MFEFYKGKQVVVAGATGLIGSYAVKHLHDSGAYVTAIIHTKKANEYALLADTMRYCDLTKTDEARGAVSGAEIVMDCAGTTGGVGLASSHPMSVIVPNILTVAQLLDASAREGVKRIGLLSSTTTYPPRDYPVKEEEADDRNPWPSYAGMSLSKLFLERLAKQFYDKCGLGVGIVRPTMAYGRFDDYDPKTGHFIPALITRALAHDKGQFVVWGDGKDVRDVLHASDVAKGLLLAVEKNAIADPINLGTGIPTTVKEVVEAIFGSMGKDTRDVIFDMTKPKGIPYRMVDLTKTKAILGFEATITLKAGLQDIIRYLMEN